MHIVSDTLKSYLMTSIMRRKQRRKDKCRLYAGRIDGECGVKYLGTYKRARMMLWEPLQLFPPILHSFRPFPLPEGRKQENTHAKSAELLTSKNTLKLIQAFPCCDCFFASSSTASAISPSVLNLQPYTSSPVVPINAFFLAIHTDLIPNAFAGL